MSKNTREDEYWDEIITPKKSWFDLGLKELWRYRDLIVLFVRRDFIAIYKQTILGPLWHFIQPLMTTVVFTIVFGNIANIATAKDEANAVPHFLFYMCGITIWNYFAQSLTKTSNTFVENSAIFGKVYFPRLAVPFANVISGLIAFTIQMLMFTGFYLYFFAMGANLKPNLYLLLIPYLVLLMAVLGLGLGIIISSMTTKYQDLRHLITFGVQLFMYASPVIYPLEVLSEKWRFYMSLNPVAPIIEGFRYAFLGNNDFTIDMLIYSTIVTIIIFLLGTALFHRVEKTFMDTV